MLMQIDTFALHRLDSRAVQAARTGLAAPGRFADVPPARRMPSA